MSERQTTYQISRIKGSPAFDANWRSSFWKSVSKLELRHFMGDLPEHFPKVQAKLAYSDDALYVIFQVYDRYVRAAAKCHQDPVSRDSCVELFFTPAPQASTGYFNFEVNCGGTMLFHVQRGRGMMPSHIKSCDLAHIELIHTMPAIVNPEIREETTWTVAFSLPMEVIKEYFPGEIIPAGRGAVWRGNLYKCADETSHPHWLTWAPVASERPDFHRPDSFGTWIFE